MRTFPWAKDPPSLTQLMHSEISPDLSPSLPEERMSMGYRFIKICMWSSCTSTYRAGCAHHLSLCLPVLPYHVGFSPGSEWAIGDRSEEEDLLAQPTGSRAPARLTSRDLTCVKETRPRLLGWEIKIELTVFKVFMKGISVGDRLELLA